MYHSHVLLPNHPCRSWQHDLQGGDSGQAAGESPDESKAAEAKLERIFEKSSFCDLQILGQFNLGFILARLGNDLFIIDQHASDEKFNFERLTKTTQLNRQPLLAPQRLDLTPSESITVRCGHLPQLSPNRQAPALSWSGGG